MAYKDVRQSASDNHDPYGLGFACGDNCIEHFGRARGCHGAKRGVGIGDHPNRAAIHSFEKGHGIPLAGYPPDKHELISFSFVQD
jgi:hypothetical protein